MKKVYVTYQISKPQGKLLWRAHMEVSDPYDWDHDLGGISWTYTCNFKGLTADRVVKKINAKLYKLFQHKYPIEICFPSSQFENTDWA